MSKVNMVDVCERMARTSLWCGLLFVVLGLLLFGVSIAGITAGAWVSVASLLLAVLTVGMGFQLLSDVKNWKIRAEWWRNNG